MKSMSLTIEKANPEEADELTKVVIASKRHWGYPDEWIDLWKDDLLITAETIKSRDFYVGRNEKEIVFVYSIGPLSEHKCELEDCWVAPQYIGQGYGMIIFEQLKTTLASLGCLTCLIISDPNAEGFYRKMGAVRVGERASKPEGRVLPLLEIEIK